ncbi:MAG: 2Fe-2S iron-sulfur cluster binding domain-containing protein [Clostridia bacterium]|nr:2Fe-2S iron-sulfur cluster binding domain-containing protein [Clostridia bacterium]
MRLQFNLNGRNVSVEVAADAILLDVLRKQGCYSVKRGCDTANCGLCTVLMDKKPILSCSTPAMRAAGRSITTLEGLQKEAEEFAGFMADQGADQCGFCNPGFVMNVLAMMNELNDPDEAQIKAYLAGNLCRCSGFVSQHRAIAAYLKFKKNGGEAE